MVPRNFYWSHCPEPHKHHNSTRQLSRGWEDSRNIQARDRRQILFLHYGAGVVEGLDAAVGRIGDVDVVGSVNGDVARGVELSRAGAEGAELQDRREPC